MTTTNVTAMKTTTTRPSLAKLWKQAEALGLMMVMHWGDEYEVRLDVARTEKSHLTVKGTGNTITQALREAIDEAERLGEQHATGTGV